MKRLSIRWRLTVWYGAVLAAVLVAFSAVVFWELREDLLGRFDDGLHEELSDVLFEVKRAKNPEGLLDWLDRRFGHHEGFDFQITDAEGKRVFASERLANRTLPMPNAASTAEKLATIDADGHYRVIEVQAPGPQGPLRIQVARSLTEFDEELSELLLAFLVAIPAALLLTLGAGYFLAGRALGPVHAITQAANQITAERLDRRIEVVNPDDELGALSQTLNSMIERLQASFHDMQRFTADAAHELRTPLAIIRNEAEVTLRAPRSPEEYGHTLANVLEETERMSQLADQLLFLCRHDAGLYPKTTASLAINELVDDVVGQMQLLGQEKNVTISILENSPAQVPAEATQLRRVCYNLLDNAIKYSREGGKVTVSCVVQDGHVRLTVADNGVGVAAEHLPHVFERFYRADPARAANGSGAGLGLPICQAIVKSLGGTIELHSVTGQGATVTVTLSQVHAPNALAV